MSQPALREPLQGEDKTLQHLVVPSRLKSRAVQVRHKRRGAYAIDRPGRVALRRLREGKGWTQPELALRAGVCVGTVQRVESGDSKRLARVSRAGLASALGVSLEAFEKLLNLPVELGDGSAAA